MKVFISGPMSGKPNYNRAAFFKAQEELERKGYSVWNPAWLAYPSNTEFTKDDMLIIDFAALRRCDAIYMLEGWKHSKGAQEEHEYAIMRGLMIMYEGVHCWGKEPEDEHDVLKRHIKTVEKALAWERWKNRLPDSVYGLTAAKFDTDSDKNTPEFDKEFSYDEAIKNRTNYQLEAIKENIKEKCNGLNRAINDVEADLDNFKDETDGKMDDIYDTLHRHGENLDSCQYDIRSLGRRLNHGYADNANKIYSLKKEVDAIKESIGTDNLQEQLEKDFADVYEEFQNTKDQVNDINMGYIKWSSEVSQFDERIEKLEENMKEIAANGGLGLSFNLMNEHVSSNKRDISSLRNDIDVMHKTANNTLFDFNTRLKAIEKRLNIKPFYAPTEDEKDD